MLRFVPRLHIPLLLFLAAPLHLQCQLCLASDCQSQSDPKFDEDSTEGYIESFAAGKELFGRVERRALVEYASREPISRQHKEKLLMLLFLSLRGAKNRSEESAAILPHLERFISEGVSRQTRIWAMQSIAFSFEDIGGGDEREGLWFERIAKATKEEKDAFLISLASTKWIRPESRFSRIKVLYTNPKVDLEFREGLVELIFAGALSGELRTSKACLFYRNLSETPENSPALTSKMFSKMAELAEASRAIEFKEAIKE